MCRRDKVNGAWNQERGVMSRNAEIKLTVDLDDENLPTRIEWEASEAHDSGPKPCQSMMLSLWDSEKKTTVTIDLWTRDTTVEEMNLHFYQVFHKMADTYLRATNNVELSKLIHEFGDGFGDNLGLVKPEMAAGPDGGEA
jgi:gliding motility-associated protein GldC